MTNIAVGLAFVVLAGVLLAVGFHVGLALAVAGILGTIVLTGNVGAVLGLLQTTPYYSVANYALIVVPLFVLMGIFSEEGGISGQAYRTLNNWMGRLPGGLSIATTWACAAFGATSGSSVACATVFTKISYPEMKAAGYDKGFSVGSIATASIIAMVIPPSLFFVYFGMLLATSISKLLIAGFLPGLLLTVLLSLQIGVMAVVKPGLAPRATVHVSWRGKFKSAAASWPILVLAGICIGGIYTGVFTPTEASAIAAFVALLMCIGFRKLSFGKLKKALLETIELTAMMALVFIGAQLFARFIVLSGIASWVGGMVISLNASPIVFVILMMAVFVVMGCFIDAFSIMAMTIPLFGPVVQALGIDLTWFGVLTVVALITGSITPPFGLVVFVTKAVAGDDVTVGQVFKGCYPFYATVAAVLVILIAFPQISLALPSMMGK